MLAEKFVFMSNQMFKVAYVKLLAKTVSVVVSAIHHLVSSGEDMGALT